MIKTTSLCWHVVFLHAVLTCVALTDSLQGGYYWYSPDERLKAEWLSDLVKVTQPVNHRVGIKIQAFWL